MEYMSAHWRFFFVPRVSYNVNESHGTWIRHLVVPWQLCLWLNLSRLQLFFFQGPFASPLQEPSPQGTICSLGFFPSWIKENHFQSRLAKVGQNLRQKLGLFGSLMEDSLRIRVKSVRCSSYHQKSQGAGAMRRRPSLMPKQVFNITRISIRWKPTETHDTCQNTSKHTKHSRKHQKPTKTNRNWQITQGCETQMNEIIYEIGSTQNHCCTESKEQKDPKAIFPESVLIPRCYMRGHGANKDYCFEVPYLTWWCFASIFSPSNLHIKKCRLSLSSVPKTVFFRVPFSPGLSNHLGVIGLLFWENPQREDVWKKIVWTPQPFIIKHYTAIHSRVDRWNSMSHMFTAMYPDCLRMIQK